MMSASGSVPYGRHLTVRNSFYHIPENISTVVDLLDEKGISWATYQENMPTDAFYGYR